MYVGKNWQHYNLSIIWKHSVVLPHAFTETGVAMLSSILNSDKAIEINLQIIRAFIKLRKMLSKHDALRLAIEGLEKRTAKNERDIQLAVDDIKKLIHPMIEAKKDRKMGFVRDKRKE